MLLYMSDFIIGNSLPLITSGITGAMSAINLEAYQTIADATKQLALKANAQDVYTRVEVDNNLSNLSSGGTINLDAYQTKSDTTTQLATKADLTYVNTALNTKANLTDVYTKNQLEQSLNSIASKANSSDVYTKNEINTALNTKVNISDINTALSGKAIIANVYSKTDVDTLLDSKADETDTVGLASVTCGAVFGRMVEKYRSAGSDIAPTGKHELGPLITPPNGSSTSSSGLPN